MNDAPNFQNPLNPDPRRRLRKVKRPIKRLNPQGGNMPAAPRASEAQNRPLPPQQNEDAFDFDAFADEANLPALSDASENDFPQNYAPQEMPQFIKDEDLGYEQNSGGFLSTLTQGSVTKKMAWIAGVVAFVVGILFAKLFLGEQKIVRDGLQGVVVNPEVPRGRARCGVAEKTQGCVLYIMNPQRQELNASDFYDLASQLTGRQRFIIETGNMRYSNRKIKPGEIAQFNIPPLQ